MTTCRREWPPELQTSGYAQPAGQVSARQRSMAARCLVDAERANSPGERSALARKIGVFCERDEISIKTR